MWPLLLFAACFPALPLGEGLVGVTDSGWPDETGGDGASGDSDPPNGPDSGGADGGSTDGGGDSGPPDTGDPPLPPFELDVGVVASPTNLLELSLNLPRSPADCLALPFADTPCADDDEDGLVDAWEAVLLDRLLPVVWLDESEPFAADSTALLVALGRVSPSPLDPAQTRVSFALAWSADYGSCDYGAHSGDSERVVLDLAPTATGVLIEQVFTGAREDADYDSSATFAGDSLSELATVADASTGEPRWVVHASTGVHSLYGTTAACEGAWWWLVCVDDDCDPDEVADRSPYERLPEVHNMGEEEARLFDRLDSLGFPGDFAWVEQRFCGGGDRTGDCDDTSIRWLLTDDPL